MLKLLYKTEVSAQISPTLFEEALQNLPLVEPKLTHTEVELLITNNEHIQELNKHYRGKDKPTDVLSFSFEEEESLGQIIISIEKAKEQAEHIGQSLEEELKFLFAHGLLHLLGYDHQKPEEEKVMLQKTYALIGRITKQ